MSDSPASGGLRNPGLLAIYCNDHLAASVGGIELLKRMLGVHRGSEHEPRLRRLLDELHEENEALTGMLHALGLPVRRYKQAAVWAAEKVSRIKLNGHLLQRSPLSTVMEFEFLASAVRAKRSGFETLRQLAAVDDRLDAAELDRLIEQANEQHGWLSHVRREVACDLFGGQVNPAEQAAGE